jgi:hypothetical protein
MIGSPATRAAETNIRSRCAAVEPLIETLMARRATNRATKLSELERTELTDDGLSKPQPHQLASFDRYRTQEVAGSSPASSIRGIRGK